MAETRDNFLIHYGAKLSGHIARQKEKTSFFEYAVGLYSTSISSVLVQLQVGRKSTESAPETSMLI